MNKYLRNKIIRNAITWPLVGAGIAGIIIGNGLLDTYESNITGLLCPTVVDESAMSDTANAGGELAVEIEEEGIALVQNRGGDNGRGILPLSDSISKVNVFGRGAIEWHYSGTGSGGVMTGKVETLNLIDALEEEGIEVNQDLISASRSKQGKVTDQSNLATSTFSTSKTFEPKISDYQSAYNAAKTFSDTAIICFGRYAGEGNDLLKQSIGLYGTNTERTSLDFSNEEEALVKQVAKDFKNVIVVINSTNVMNLEFIESVEGVDACLVVGTPGTVGARAIKNVIWGTVVPSGHLADTYVYDFRTTPNFYNSGYDYMGIYNDSDKHNGAYAGCTFRSAKKAYRGMVNPGADSWLNDGAHATYVDYTDGIYVGYRWYETADAEGFWSGVSNTHGTGYDGVVQYPFGYGLSYVSNFDWELVPEKCSPAAGSTINENTKVEITVKVTNKDVLYSGKDVVQVYLTAPYDETNAPIEKSYVSLVGFGKTSLLEPGQSEELTIKLDTWDFKSFDTYDVNANSHTGYEMEAGDYVLRLRTDSHSDKVMTGGNTITYNVPTTIKIDEDRDTHAPIKPIMSVGNAVDGFSIDGKDSNQNITYITRKAIKDKTYSLPTAKPADRSWNTALEVSKGGTTAQPDVHNCGNTDLNLDIRWNTYSQEMSVVWDNYGSTHNGKDPFGNTIPTTKPTFNASKKVKLVDGMQLTAEGLKCAQDYNDPLWQEALDGVSWSSSYGIIHRAHTYDKPAIGDLGIPETSDHDGPSQINTSADAGLASYLTGYPNPTVLAQTWNEKLAFKFGKSYASDMTTIGVDCSYGFACNIHRTPFGGRNFEYFSEDPFLSGRQASQSCRGVQVSGKTTYLKHFVCNDQETWRCGVYTWLTEQAFREIYAKPFEIAIKDDSTTAIMSSFNRVGATWAGGSEAANQGMMRNEWGFHGAIKTDYGEDCDVMDFAQCVRAGETIGLADSLQHSVMLASGQAMPSNTSSAISPRFAHRIRETVHEVAWTYIHSLYLNKKYNEDVNAGLIDDEIIVATQSKRPWVWWKPTVFALEALIVGGMGIAAYFAIRPMDYETIFESEDKKTVRGGK